jgi:hypothetical protein
MTNRRGRRKRRPSGPQSAGKQSGGPSPRPGAIGLARIEGNENAFELVHPRCVRETELDYQEGIELWKAGDPEGARDALRYALLACHENLWVHVALGKIALEEFRDPILARGHFGYAVELGRRAFPPGFSGRLPHTSSANQPFFEALGGLVQCLRVLGKNGDADSLRALAARLGEGSNSNQTLESKSGNGPQADKSAEESRSVPPEPGPGRPQ